MDSIVDEPNEMFGALKVSPFWSLGQEKLEGTDSKLAEASKSTSTDVVKQTSLKSRSPLVSFKRSWEEWAGGTTLHGIKFVFDAESLLVRRIFWFIVFGTLIYFLIGACMVQTERFLQYKTVTKTTINLEKKLTLPAVTICNLNLIKNDSVEDSETRDLLKNLYVPHPNVNFIESLGDDFLQNVSLRKIFVDGSPTESFLYCTLFLDIVDCNKIVTRKITETGYCHTFGAEEPKQNYDTQVTGVSGGVSFLVLLQQNNYFISEGFSAGIKVIIHERDEEPDHRFALSFSPGYSYFISLRKKERVFLPYPVKAFGSQECTDTKSEMFRNPLEHYKDYSPYACLMECQSKFIQNRCNCSDTFSFGNYSECTPLQLIHCVYEAKRYFTTKYNTETCNCPLPCFTTSYKTTVSSSYYPNVNHLKVYYGDDSLQDYLRQNLVQIQIYYETLVTTRDEQMLEFTSEDLTASFGGFLGLAIGASMITILEVLELFVISLYRCARGK